jgi:branched-chain amino acid transport system substrate-binding protein
MAKTILRHLSPAKDGAGGDQGGRWEKRPMFTRRAFLHSAAASAAFASPLVARAANAPGITDTEIKIGQTMPYSGPASAYGKIGQAEIAYFRMINEKGGVNGRKINLISIDDGYSPPKTVEQTRRLVEQDGVAFIFNSLGTASGLAVRGYLNEKHIPQLFAISGSSQFADGEHFPWSIGLQPSYRSEGRVCARYFITAKPEGRIALLYQNDGYGQDFRSGLLDALGDGYARRLIKEVTYEIIEPTVDSQVVTLHASGADIFVIAATPKAAAQAIRKSYDLGWQATRYVMYGSSSIPAVLKPAGLDKSKGMLSAIVGKDVNDPQWKDDGDVKEYREFVKNYLSPDDFGEFYSVAGYSNGWILVRLLQQCGDDLSRENIMRQATNLHGLKPPFALPGASIDTSPADYRVSRYFQMATFDGESWKPLGDVLKD